LILNYSDGGGIRGLFGLFGMKEMMNRLSFDQKDHNLDKPKPRDYFDLAAGSGTGGWVGESGAIYIQLIQLLIKAGGYSTLSIGV
jgi:hypothetical protein